MHWGQYDASGGLYNRAVDGSMGELWQRFLNNKKEDKNFTPATDADYYNAFEKYIGGTTQRCFIPRILIQRTGFYNLEQQIGADYNYLGAEVIDQAYYDILLASFPFAKPEELLPPDQPIEWRQFMGGLSITPLIAFGKIRDQFWGFILHYHQQGAFNGWWERLFGHNQLNYPCDNIYHWRNSPYAKLTFKDE